MKLLARSVCLFVIIFLTACSSESANEATIPVDDEVAEEETPKEVLDLVNVQTIANTPIPGFDSFLVFGDKVYTVKAKDTYVFDFTLATWSFLGTDQDMPDFLNLGISFLRNGKWNLFTEGGLFEFDFDLEDWKAIDRFPQANGIFYTDGFYIAAEEAIYFIDRANGNDTIYKYDLQTNELISHSSYDNKGDYGGISNNTFTINGSNYLLKLEAYTQPAIYKFNDDFSELLFVNEYRTEDQLDGGIAMQLGNYIIFGLGGIPSANGDVITSDPSTLKFYSYDVLNDVFAEMPSSFYESCRVANLVTYNNEFYVLNGFTIKDQRSEARNTFEKIEFEVVTP